MRISSSTATTLFLIAGLSLSLCAQPSERQLEWATGSVTSSDGVSISYQTAGEGPVSLVFVHGWLCDRSYWSEQLDHFAAANRVVALDLAGHGDSGLNRDEWTMAAFGEDVAAVVNELELEQVVLVGHSMGAAVIVEAARRAADRVIGLVVVDNFQDLDAPITPAQVEDIIAPFIEDFRESTRDIVATMFVPASDPVLVKQIVEDMSSAPAHVGIGAARNLFLWYGQHDDEALRAVHVPIRAINSDQNPTDLEVAARYGIEVTLMTGVGHFVMMEDPETFNSLLSEAVADFGRGRPSDSSLD